MLIRNVAAKVHDSPLSPHNWLPSVRAARVLWRDLGHLKSVRSGQALDGNGNPLPWYTYPAIEYLSQLDFRDRTVFEFGSGMSTLFWARAAKEVTAVEDNEGWFATVAALAPQNAHVILETDISEFPRTLRTTGKRYDVIVVDGPARGGTRLKCARAALEALNPGGLIILDNSDWLPESSRALREHGLLEVDMTGFAPICGHVQTTSFYFDRSFNIQPLTDRQPVPGHGAQQMNWEVPLAPVPGEVIECDSEKYRAVESRRGLLFDTPEGARRFEAFTYLGNDDNRWIGIIDRDRDRVLLTRHQSNGTGPAGELDRLATMPWVEFRRFVSDHPWRRYRL